MKAAMLVLEPIFEADLTSELYAYRPAKHLAGGGRGGGAAPSSVASSLNIGLDDRIGQMAEVGVDRFAGE